MMCFQSPQSISQSPCEMNHPQDPQWGPYRERCPFTEPSFAHTLMKKKSSVKDSLSMFPQWGPCGERCFVSRASGLFIHSLSLRVPISPMKWVGGGEHMVTICGVPHGQKALHTLGCGLVPHGDRLWHCCLYSSAMQPSAWYYPLWLE